MVVFITFVSLTSLSLTQVNGSLVIKYANSKFIDFKREPTQGNTWIYPPQTRYIVVGYIFEIILHVTVKNRPLLLDSLYGVVCILPDDSNLKFIIDRRNLIESSPNEIKYFFPLEVKRKGWIKIILVSLTEMQGSGNSKFYKNRSNEYSIYLRPQRVKE